LSYKVVFIGGKCEVYINGKLCCIARNMSEADKVINKYAKMI
jgi:hypothetical protein